MTRRVWTAIAVAVTLVAGMGVAPGSGSLAQNTQTKKAKAAKSQTIKGTILEWNDAGKSFKVKADNGEEMTFTWNDATQMHGTARVGEKVKVMTKKGEARLADQIFIGQEGAGDPDKGKKSDG